LTIFFRDLEYNVGVAAEVTDKTDPDSALGLPKPAVSVALPKRAESAGNNTEENKKVADTPNVTASITTACASSPAAAPSAPLLSGAAPAVPEPLKSPVYTHGTLIDYLRKVLPPLEEVTLADYEKFCLHSPESNGLRWYALHCDTSDSDMTEILARDHELPMLPPEKHMIMPRAADLFARWCQGAACGWIPLYTSGAFLWVANYDPFEPFPVGVPVDLVQKVLLSANVYDLLLESWRAVLVDWKHQSPLGPFPVAAPEQLAWFARLGISPGEAAEVLRQLRERRIPWPLKDLSLRRLTLMDANFWHQTQVFPFFRFQNIVFAAASLSLSARDLQSLRAQLEFRLSLTPVLVLADAQEIQLELQLFNQAQPESRVVTEQLEVQDYLTKLLDHALSGRISDIHLEPYEGSYRVRWRQDGSLVPYARLSNDYAALLINRIKILASMDISERRQPHEGSFRHRSNGRDFDLRASVISQFEAGERVVLRILDARRVPGSLEELGFAAGDIAAINGALECDHGLFLVSGPTGSGKTTTLYAALKSLPLDTCSVQTVEDPPEFKLEGCAQYIVRPEENLNCSKLLRHILRADPDIILIGEIRDPDTAQVACAASNTGHLVLSSLHSNDALSSLFRLRDFGVSLNLLVDVVRLILSQRLIRRLCRRCKHRRAITAVERTAFLKQRYPLECLDTPLFAARGCHACNYTGYQNRFAVVESLCLTNPVAEAVLAGVSRKKIGKLLDENKFRSMYKAGMAYALRGETSFNELSGLFHS